MDVSSLGLAVSLDSLGHARAFDIFHQQKVFKYSPESTVDSNSSCAYHLSLPLVSAKAEQTLVLGYKDNNPQKTSILIYKNFENLLNLYPGLSSLCRKGVDRAKLSTLFPNLTPTQLTNRDLEVTLDLQLNNTQSVVQQEKKVSSILKKDVCRIPSEKSMSTIDMNSSFHSKVKQVQINKVPQKFTHTTNLTFEALNRDNMYQNQNENNVQTLYHIQKHPIQKLNDTIKKKQIRQNNVEKAMAKIENELKLQEEQKILELRQKMLQRVEK